MRVWLRAPVILSISVFAACTSGEPAAELLTRGERNSLLEESKTSTARRSPKNSAPQQTRVGAAPQSSNPPTGWQAHRELISHSRMKNTFAKNFRIEALGGGRYEASLPSAPISLKYNVKDDAVTSLLISAGISSQTTRTMTVQFVLDVFDLLFPAWKDRQNWLNRGLADAESGEGPPKFTYEDKEISLFILKMDSIGRRILFVSIAAK